jgi:Domain of unknown function (DUF6894)
MGPYYFTLTDGKHALGRREPTELSTLLQVHEEAVAFGRAVLKHRHTLGIDDITPWAVRVTSEVGRVLLVLPLSEIKKPRQNAVRSQTASGIVDVIDLPTYSGEAIASRKRLANSALR